MPSASSASAIVSKPSTNGTSGMRGRFMWFSSTMRYAVESGWSRTKLDVRE